ncbi:hypothetical protein [Desulfurivibrio sp. C05AmB]|uniref:hypothetical protein n=1 Tax=Desulfurivibrio sp. C05AmB TaxID=3374371 RepID=UPI00376EC1CC
MNKSEAIELLAGLIAFSAVLSALCYSAARSCPEKINKSMHYRFSAECLLQATLAGAIGLALHYSLQTPPFSASGLTVHLVRVFYHFVIGCAFGVGLVSLHMAVWHLQKEALGTH